MTEPELILKTTPPRLPSDAIERDRLLPFRALVPERTAMAVVAPAGFGKTTLLLQWRRHWVEKGALVAWLSADAQDEPMRFTRALLKAFRAGSERAALHVPRTHYESKCDQDIAMLTALLAEIALSGIETVLMLDDAEQLPEATVVTSLRYMLINAPANLHLVVASRVLWPKWTSELMASGSMVLLGKEDLRLQAEESAEILSQHLGPRLDVDQSAKLHDAVQGWPICLRFAIARIKFERDSMVASDAFQAREDNLWEYFIDSLFSGLPAPDADFLTRVAILDHVNADLCEAVTGSAQAEAQLKRLMRETPLIMLSSYEGWGRLHPLTRDFLLGHFRRLPRAEQIELHARASAWFAERGRFHEAAHHALATGDEAQAHAYAMKSLWELGAEGRLAEAQEWLGRIPAQQLAIDVSFKLAASWVFALSDRNEEALRLALELADHPGNAVPLRMAALRVAGGAAIYADHLGLLPQVLAQWPQNTGNIQEPLYAVAPLNASAILALHSGSTAEVRDLTARIVAHGETGSLRLAAAVARAMIGLSHLWDGNPCHVEAVLRPALNAAEKEEGRRGMVACIYAAVLAAALLERGEAMAAAALLANRLDVIESSFPDIVLAAYRALVFTAAGNGDERRALATLDGLDALAKRRRLPRLQMHCLAEQIRIHALGGRPETAERLVRALRKLAPAFQQETLRMFLPQYDLTYAVARAYAAFARSDMDEVDRQLRSADALAEQLHQGREKQRIKVLRAMSAWQRGIAGAPALLSEAIGLANLGGNARLLIDTHPQAAKMAHGLIEAGSCVQMAMVSEPKKVTLRPSNTHSPATVARQSLLTAKETEVLRLLSNGMSNKLIARALDVSNETVKWHLKNLFQKLSVNTRKHAINRARLLGLVDC